MMLPESVKTSDERRAANLWAAFGRIAIDDDQLITEPFLHFPAGVTIFDVRGWMDKAFGEDVMSRIAKDQPLRRGQIPER